MLFLKYFQFIALERFTISCCIFMNMVFMTKFLTIAVLSFQNGDGIKSAMIQSNF